MAELQSLLIDSIDQVPLDTIEITQDQHRLLSFCERLTGEAQAHMEELGITRRMESVLDFLSNPWGKRHREEKKHRARVWLNVIRSIVERQVGMLTETRPQGGVLSTTGAVDTADVLKRMIESIWWERGIQQSLTDGIVMCQKNGFSPCYAPYDFSLDYGRGNVRMDFLQSDQAYIDPLVRRASEVQDGDYVVIRRVLSLPHLREIYRKRGHLVNAQKQFSSYTKISSSDIKSPISQKLFSYFRKPSRKQENVEEGAIPRAEEFRLYFRDRRLHPTEPFIKDLSHPDGQRANYLFPRKRLLAWSNGVMLYDGHSRYWDGHYPLEMLDWGIETEHPFGESMVDLMRTMQSAMNVLVSGAVDNTRLMNDPPMVLDHGVLNPEDLTLLRRWGDRPGWTWIKQRPGEFRRDYPGQLTGVVFNVIEFLKKEMQQSFGISEIAQGERPPGVVSGVSIDSLMLIAQIVIRLQARAIEDFISRIGQLLISRVIQFYPDKRLMSVLGADEKVANFLWDREAFLKDALQAENLADLTARVQDLYRDYKFYVIPKSGLAVARMQKQAMMERYYSMGIVPAEMVLESAEIPDPKGTLQKARDEQAQLAMMQQRASMPAPPPTPGVPSALQGGVGTENMQAGGAQSPQRPDALGQNGGPA